MACKIIVDRESEHGKGGWERYFPGILGSSSRGRADPWTCILPPPTKTSASHAFLSMKSVHSLRRKRENVSKFRADRIEIGPTAAA